MLRKLRNGNTHRWAGLFFAVGMLISVPRGFSEKPEDSQSLVDGQMKMVRERKLAPVFKGKSDVRLTPYMEKYLKDPDPAVRIHAYAYIKHEGLKSASQGERRNAVEILLQGGREEQEDRDSAFISVLSFQMADFSNIARKILHDELAKNPTREHLVLAVGVADMKDELPVLKKIIEESKEPMTVGSLSFAALRARARMGVEEDIQRCIDLVEAEPREEFRVQCLLERLSYVRQPEVVNYIKKYYMMDTLEHYAGPDVGRASYAERAEKALSLMIRGFPRYKLEVRKPPFTESWNEYRNRLLKQNREWIDKQTKWDLIR